jgi:hypothetical protein
MTALTPPSAALPTHVSTPQSASKVRKCIITIATITLNASAGAANKISAATFLSVMSSVHKILTALVLQAVVRKATVLMTLFAKETKLKVIHAIGVMSA